MAEKLVSDHNLLWRKSRESQKSPLSASCETPESAIAVADALSESEPIHVPSPQVLPFLSAPVVTRSASPTASSSSLSLPSTIPESEDEVDPSMMAATGGKRVYMTWNAETHERLLFALIKNRDTGKPSHLRLDYDAIAKDMGTTAKLVAGHINYLKMQLADDRGDLRKPGKRPAKKYVRVSSQKGADLDEDDIEIIEPPRKRQIVEVEKAVVKQEILEQKQRPIKIEDESVPSVKKQEAKIKYEDDREFKAEDDRKVGYGTGGSIKFEDSGKGEDEIESTMPAKHKHESTWFYDCQLMALKKPI